MRSLKKKYTSPIMLSLLHLFPSLLLIGMMVVAIISLGFGERRVVLGAQSSMPLIKTMTVEDRIKELSRATEDRKSEIVESAERDLRK